MTAWPTAQDLFDQLANGQAPTDWASKIVRLIKNENGIEACVFQDRDDTSVRIAGPAPSKTHAIKKELAIRASGLDASGRFHTTLRFVFLNGTSIAVDQQLDQIAKDSVDILSSRIRKQSAPKAASEPQPNEVLPESACPARTTNTSASRCKEKASGVTRAAPSLKYGIFVAGPATQKVIVEIEQLAPNPYPVLILGPTGTGKERVAQAVHQASGRTGSRVSLNCAAFTSDLIGSELFGHVKGAFTGADKDREGVIQQADHGTLFLDEIGELNPKHQATLLRVLQEGSVRRIGSAKEEKVDVRVIAATNRPLQEMVASGAFREDLFYRLAGAAIEVLPLSDRRDEILPLAEHYITTLSLQLHKPLAMTSELRDLLPRLPWPGNVRELFRTLEIAASLAGSGPIGPELLRISDCSAARASECTQAGTLLHFPILLPKLSAGNGQPSPLSYAVFQERLEDLDSSLISLILQVGGSVDKAAALLQATPETLRARMLHHRIPEPTVPDYGAEIAV